MWIRCSGLLGWECLPRGSWAYRCLRLAHELAKGSGKPRPLKVGSALAAIRIHVLHAASQVALLNGANRKLCGNHWFQSRMPSCFMCSFCSRMSSPFRQSFIQGRLVFKVGLVMPSTRTCIVVPLAPQIGHDSEVFEKVETFPGIVVKSILAGELRHRAQVDSHISHACCVVLT